MAEVSCLVNRYDHVEFATRDLSALEKIFAVFGFKTAQTRDNVIATQKLMVQGQTRFLLSQGKPGSFQHSYSAKHGDGVCSIAFHTDSVEKTLATALSRGAKLAQALVVETDPKSALRFSVASIESFGEVRAAFVNRSQKAFDSLALFAPGFQIVADKPEDFKGVGMISLDHLTNNVEMNSMEKWCTFYKEVYGWVEARYFDIRGASTGLHSKVMQSPDGAVKIPVNEATEAKSQVQEFIDQHKGAGVQHIALMTTDIRSCVGELTKRGVRFLKVLPSYYEKVARRLPNVTEPLKDLEGLGILVDGDEKGYLLQIFTENQVGPFFMEVIQRKGHNGFGDGNFSALFEAIELDQKRRGVL